MFISEASCSTTNILGPQETVRGVQLTINNRDSVESIVRQLNSTNGPLDVYLWYEGPRGGVPESGAEFIRAEIFDKINPREDLKLYPYSLTAWSFDKSVSDMPETTPLGTKINEISTKALECIYSTSFFRYCATPSETREIYQYVQEALPKKRWLKDMSQTRPNKGKTVYEFFNNSGSLLDCIGHSDVNKAYSLMQYIEGYYLIQKSVKIALRNKKKEITIAFVLPNDENKYYDTRRKGLGLSRDLKPMLQKDFGEALKDIDIKVSFYLFNYGDNQGLRPYIDNSVPSVDGADISKYLGRFSVKSCSQRY